MGYFITIPIKDGDKKEENSVVEVKGVGRFFLLTPTMGFAHCTYDGTLGEQLIRLLKRAKRPFFIDE